MFTYQFPQSGLLKGREAVIGLRFSVTKLAGLLGWSTVCRAGVCRGVMGTAWSDQAARGLKTTRNPQYAPCLCPPKHLHTKGTKHHRYQVLDILLWYGGVPKLQKLSTTGRNWSLLCLHVKCLQKLNVLKFDVKASEYWFRGLRPPGFRLGQLCLQPRGMYIRPRK